MSGPMPGVKRRKVAWKVADDAASTLALVRIGATGEEKRLTAFSKIMANDLCVPQFADLLTRLHNDTYEESDTIVRAISHDRKSEHNISILLSQPYPDGPRQEWLVDISSRSVDLSSPEKHNFIFHESAVNGTALITCDMQAWSKLSRQLIQSDSSGLVIYGSEAFLLRALLSLHRNGPNIMLLSRWQLIARRGTCSWFREFWIRATTNIAQSLKMVLLDDLTIIAIAYFTELHLDRPGTVRFSDANAPVFIP